MAAIIRLTYKVTHADGRTVTRKYKHWTIQYRDGAGKIRRVKGYTDKEATRQLAAKLERAQARGEEGLVNPYRVHLARPIAEHVAEYLSGLTGKGKDDQYIYATGLRLNRIIDGCGWKRLADVEPNGFVRWRDKEKSATERRQGSKGGALSAATINQYLDTARAFLNWCATTGRIDGVIVPGRNRDGTIRKMSPLLAAVPKVDGAKVRKRRALKDEEVEALLGVAAADRLIVYRLALASGLRRSELEALKWGDIRIDATRPYIQLRAEATKARRGDQLDIPQTLAADLRAIRPAGVKESDAVFATVPPIEYWKADLAAAGIPYMDEMGRAADFHAGTRKTMCTRLNREGVPLAVAMKKMRHTDPDLTLVDYTDEQAVGMEAAVLPELTPRMPIKPAGAVSGA